MPEKPRVGLLLEHPAAQENQKSVFDHPMWRSFAEEELMGEVSFEMNGRRTILGGNLNLWYLEGATMGALTPRTSGCSVWPMEMVAHVAGALRSWTGLRHREGLLASLTRRLVEGDVDPVRLAKFDVSGWKLHLQRDHLPYRRDCRVCVARASGRPHRKVSHPSAYSLAVDTAGPFRSMGAGGFKYLLVGCYRFPKLPGIGDHQHLEAEEGDPGRAPDDGGDWIFEDEAVDREVDAPAEGDAEAPLGDDEPAKEEHPWTERLRASKSWRGPWSSPQCISFGR